MKNTLHSRAGSMPILIVLAMISILLVSVLSNYKTGRNYRNLVKRSALEFQAHYMAVSALQHAELKIRYFPTELYDASEYSQGKNPYFDFSEIAATEYTAMSGIRQVEYKIHPSDSSYYIHIAGMFNPGPRFLSEGTLGTDNTDKWFRLSALDPMDSDPKNFSTKTGKWFGTAGWPKIDGKAVPNSDLYLWKFMSDITTNSTTQPALACLKDPAFNITKANSMPYEGGYEIKSIEVLSVKEHRRLNEEAIRVQAKGWAKDPITLEVVEMNMDKTLKVSRR